MKPGSVSSDTVEQRRNKANGTFFTIIVRVRVSVSVKVACDMLYVCVEDLLAAADNSKSNAGSKRKTELLGGLDLNSPEVQALLRKRSMNEGIVNVVIIALVSNFYCA